MKYNFNTNKKIWDENDVVEKYKKQKGWMGELLAPEKSVLQFVKDNNFNTMLDLGVGTGRTTSFFLPYIQKYHGIDYSEKMIECCKNRFENYRNASFQVNDARNLECYENQYFDFILFSCNGLDYMDHNDRIKTIKEIYRICKPNGFFCFSTHNELSIKNYYKVKFTLHPTRMINNIKKYIKFKQNNPGLNKLNYGPYVYVNDPCNNWRIITYYIDPQYQNRQLDEIGFDTKYTYALESGIENSNMNNLKINKDKWIYFLAQKNKLD